MYQHFAIFYTFLHHIFRTGCCKCHGEECRRISDDVVVRFIAFVLYAIATLCVALSLTDVSAAQVQYVMDIIYSGG